MLHYSLEVMLLIVFLWIIVEFLSHIEGVLVITFLLDMVFVSSLLGGIIIFLQDTLVLLYSLDVVLTIDFL